MHETIIANDIIEKAKLQGNVKKIIVEVGMLAHLPAEDMLSTLKRMTDWHVDVIKKEAKVKCECGFLGTPNILEHHHDFALFECPECKALPEILDGKDIVLKSVELE